MARPQSFTADEVAQAAFDVARERGLSGLTVRAVAQALGSSTQPVYTTFGSMGQMRDEVTHRVEAFIGAFLSEPEPGAPPPLSLGLRTVRLALEDPTLYGIAEGVMARMFDADPPLPVAEMFRADDVLAALPETTLRMVHRLLWVFTVGLCQLAGPDGPITSVEQARPLLEAGGSAIVLAARQGMLS